MKRAHEPADLFHDDSDLYLKMGSKCTPGAKHRKLMYEPRLWAACKGMGAYDVLYAFHSVLKD